ncbi:MAG: erythromycin esterase family protein [Methanomicrobiaceae archaeon]|nr:erythromycin esterase family protein [Methanomicrobiaceae archaeon]
MRYATLARQLVNYHAEVATPGAGERIVRLLGMREAMMADNLAYIVSVERGRGKVLAFAHNSHLRRGKAEWQLGTPSPGGRRAPTSVRS